MCCFRHDTNMKVADMTDRSTCVREAYQTDISISCADPPDGCVTRDSHAIVKSRAEKEGSRLGRLWFSDCKLQAFALLPLPECHL